MDLSACRTAALGGWLEQCSACGQYEYHYRSCGNRHCPKCQASRRAAWLEREAGYLLPVEYHHLVFTLPQPVALLAPDNPRLVYGLLLQASIQTVLEVAANPKHLGAQVGLTAVLHTWGQTLSLHPNVHLLASGGGLSCNRRGEVEDEPVWRSCRPGFFLPVRVLSALFRGKVLAGLRQAYEQGQLLCRGPQAALADPRVWLEWWQGLARQAWVVYSQPPCAGPEVVLKYLARYSFRVALSNSRLVAVTEDEVTFHYKDYRRRGQVRQMTLSGPEFARRFLQHVLPRGLVRVRHAGLLANRGREAKLPLCRSLLGQTVTTDSVGPEPEEVQPRCCRACGEGFLEVVQVLPGQSRAPAAGLAQREDSS